MPRALHKALSFTAIAVEESAPCKAVALISLRNNKRCPVQSHGTNEGSSSSKTVKRGGC